MESRITPEMARQELARRELAKRQSMQSQMGSAPFNTQQPAKNNQQNIQKFSDVTGANRTPLDTIRNLLAGVGDAGQNIAHMLGSKAPNVDIGEAFGSQNNPMDKFQQGIGQFLPGMTLGPINALSRMGGGQIANVLSRGAPMAGYAATQSENPLGAASTVLALESALPAGRAISAGINAFRPGLASEELMNKIGGTKNVLSDAQPSWENGFVKPKINRVNATENAERIANTLNTSAEMQKHEALSHMESVKSALGKKDIAGENLRDLNYLSRENNLAKKYYGPGLKKAHEQFLQTRNFNDAHNLESKLGKEVSTLLKRQRKDTIDTDGELKLEYLNNAYRSLKEDMDSLVKEQPKNIQNEWASFKKKYRENFKPYESTSILRNITKGITKGKSPTKINRIFSHPTEEVQKFTSDLPTEAKNYILYNELAGLKPNDAEGILNALNKMEQTGGLGSYITPEIRNLKDLIGKRINNQNKLVVPKFYRGAKAYLKAKLP